MINIKKIAVVIFKITTYLKRFLETFQSIAKGLFYHIESCLLQRRKNEIPYLVKSDFERLKFDAERCQNIGKIAKITCFYIFLHQNLRCMKPILINEV